MTHRFPFIKTGVRTQTHTHTLHSTRVIGRSHLFTFSHIILSPLSLSHTYTHINRLHHPLLLPSRLLPLGRDFPLLKMKGGKGRGEGEDLVRTEKKNSMVETEREREREREREVRDFLRTHIHTRSSLFPPFIISGSALISRECCLASVALGQAPGSEDTPLTGHRYRQITSRPAPPPSPSSHLFLRTN